MTCPDPSSPPWPRTGAAASILRLLGAALLVSGLSGSALGASEVELLLLGPSGEGIGGAVFSAVPEDEAPPPPSQAALMDQRDKAFVPHVLPVTTGTAVTFENSDSIGHHVYSFSPPKRFDFYLSEGESHEEVFEAPGVVALGCNVHDWMLAYVLVLETAHFTTTDAEGRAVLEGLPPGDYSLRAWHPRIDREERRLRKDLSLAESGRKTWRVTLERPLLPDRTGERNPEYGSPD